MATEPTLEQLSAYVDGEVDGSARNELEAHLKTCSSCQARLDGLRQTVSAVRALPMETPPRAFTVPAQRRQALRWAPFGWATSGAAATAIVIFLISQGHIGGGAATPSLSSNSGAAGAAARAMVAPLARPQLGAAPQDHNAYSAASVLSGQQVTVSVPGNAARNLTLSTDARSYAANGVLTLRVSTEGLSPDEARTVMIFLSRDRGLGGYAIRLAPPSSDQTYTAAFDASYAIPNMQLQVPQDGTYTLQVTVDLSGGSSLIAYLPVTITP